jgi:hypothetical protein
MKGLRTRLVLASLAAIFFFLSVLLGFMDCGGYSWAKFLLTISLVALTALATVSLGSRNVGLSHRRWFACLALLGFVSLYVLGFSAGQALYLPPSSISQLISLGC